MADLPIKELSKILLTNKARWKAAENPISKMNPIMRKKLLGVDENAVSWVPLNYVNSIQSYSLPSLVDWRNKNGNHVTGVKDQGGCGSCVSFGTVAVTESMVSIEKGKMLDLSEADQYFCSSHGASCHGWNPKDAFNEIKNRGVADDAYFPYNTAFPNNDIYGSTPTCRGGPDRNTRTVKVTTVHSLNSNAEAKNHLSTIGPIVCCFDVYADFHYYQSGIYNHVTGEKEGSHCVQIVGYSDIDNCWICKNSWNSSWGNGGYVNIAYGTCNIDKHTKYGITGITFPSQWQNFSLIPAQNSATDGSITVVSRIPESMEVFWIGPDGSVRDAFWYNNSGWKNFILAPAGTASTNGSIAAVSRASGSMEVFWIGPDGSVRDAYWSDKVGWKNFILAPAGSASTNGSIAAVSRASGSMEVFWIGPDGSVRDAYWSDKVGWNHFVLAPAGSASTNGSIAAVSRASGSMEVFWIGPDGSVRDAYWSDKVGWNHFVLAPAGSASTNGSIAAVSRIKDSMEVFWIGPDGSVRDAFWYNNAGWKNFILAPAGTASTNGSITAVSRIPGSMEVWNLASNGAVQDYWWNQ